MPKRLPVELGLDTPTLTPTAEPVNTYFKPALPAPVLQPIIDLSPLSEIAAKIAHDQATIAAEKDKQAGKSAVLAAQQELAKAEKGREESQSAWAKAVAAGTVPEGASPWTRVGAMEAMGQDLMDKYGRDLQSAMDSVSRTQDEQGNPVIAEDPAKVIAKVWEKYASNPVFKDFYAQRIAVDQKPKIDAGFQADAAATLGKNQAEFRYHKVTQEQAAYLNDLAVKGEPWTPEVYSKFKEWQDKQLYGRSMKEIHRSTLDAVKTVAAQEAEIDPNAAAAFIDHAMDLPSGTTTLGKDVRTGTELAELKRKYLNDGEEKNSKQRREKLQAREDTIRTAVDQALNIMSQATAQGKNPIDAGNAEIAHIRAANDGAGAYGELTGTVSDAIEQLVKNRVESSRPGLESQLQARIETGDIQGMESELQSLLTGGSLSWKGYAGLRDALARRQDVTALVEDNPVHLRGQQTIAALVPQDLPPEVRGAIQSEVEQDSVRFTQEMAEYAATLKGTNLERAPELRKWATAWIADLSAKRRAEGASLKSARDTAIQGIEQQIARHEDPSSAVQEAVQAGLLTRQEAGLYRGTAEGLAGGRWFLHQQEYTDARNVLAGIVQEKVQELGKPSEVTGQYQNMLSFAYDKLRSRYTARLSTDLKEVPLALIPEKSAAILQEVVTEVTKDIGDETRSRAQAFVAAGETFTEAVTKAQEAPAAEKSKTATFDSIQASAKASGRTAYRAYLNQGRVAVVDPEVYEAIDGLTLDEVAHARRPVVEQTAWSEAKRLVDTQNPQAADAAHSLARHLVIPWRDAAVGTLAIYPARLQVVEDSKEIARMGDALAVELIREGHQHWYNFALDKSQANSFWAGVFGPEPKGAGDTITSHAFVYDPAAIKKVALPGSRLADMADAYAGKMSLMMAQKAVKIPLDVSKIDPYLDPFVSSYADWEALADTPAAVTALMGSLGLPTDAANREKWLVAQRQAVGRTNPDLVDPKDTQNK